MQTLNKWRPQDQSLVLPHLCVLYWKQEGVSVTHYVENTHFNIKNNKLNINVQTDSNCAAFLNNSVLLFP